MKDGTDIEIEDKNLQELVNYSPAIYNEFIL